MWWKGGEEKINVKRRPLSHSKSLGRGGTLVVGPIDKDILGKEVVFDKLEGTTFERSRMIK